MGTGGNKDYSRKAAEDFEGFSSEPDTVEREYNDIGVYDLSSQNDLGNETDDFDEADDFEDDFGETSDFEDDFGEVSDFEDDFTYSPENAEDISFNQPGTNGIIGILKPRKISNSETELNVSVNDLVYNFIVSENAAEDEDYKDFLQLINNLEDAGYHDLNDSYTFETLCSLQKREESIKNKDAEVNVLKASVARSVKICRDVLAATKATLTETGNYYDNEYLRNNYSSEFGNDVQIAIQNIAGNLRKQGKPVTAQEVFNCLVESGKFSGFSDDKQTALSRYLEQVIPILTEHENETIYKNEAQRKARKRAASILTRSILRAASSLIVTDNENISYIKNVTIEPSGLNVECPCCGKGTLLHNAPIAVILFSSEKEGSAIPKYDIPLPVVCSSCGKVLIFTKEEYDTMKKCVFDAYKVLKNSRSKGSIMTSALQQAEILCKGASVLNLSPSVAAIYPAVTELVRNDSREDNSFVKNEVVAVSLEGDSF